MKVSIINSKQNDQNSVPIWISTRKIEPADHSWALNLSSTRTGCIFGGYPKWKASSISNSSQFPEGGSRVGAKETTWKLRVQGVRAKSQECKKIWLKLEQSRTIEDGLDRMISKNTIGCLWPAGGGICVCYRWQFQTIQFKLETVQAIERDKREGRERWKRLGGTGLWCHECSNSVILPLTSTDLD